MHRSLPLPVIACACCLAAGAEASQEVIPFREAWGWAIVLPVTLGRSGTHELLLDTGTASTILEPELAAELGVVPRARTNLVTPAGARPATVGSVALRIGSILLPDVEVVVAELPALRRDEPRLAGILGQSALSRLEYTIDHARRRLVVHRVRALGPDGNGTAEAWRPTADAPARPVLEAHPGCGKPAVRLVLDSGVPVPVLFAQGRQGWDVALGGGVHASTNAGDALWRAGRLASLCVGGVRAGPVDVVVRPAGATARVEDGLLPSRYFARVHIGFEAAVVGLDHW